MLCSRCGNDCPALVCQNCGATLPKDQSRELAAVYRQLAKLGGNETVSPYSDEYFTPPEAIRILVPYLPRGKIVWEVAWGRGDLAAVLRQEGFTVVGRPKVDFLTAKPPKFDLIVSNPPFSLKTRFLQRCYSFGKPFALLMPLDSLTSVERYPLYQKHGLQLLVPSRRIHFLEQKHSDFPTAWFCWRLLPADLLFADLPHPNARPKPLEDLG
jgi:hypothetical protein